MDSIRTKRSNKKPWIIGGTIAAAVLIIIIILCVTLGSSAEEGSVTKVKDVYEALTFVETTLGKTYEKEEGVKGPLVTDVRKLTEKVRMVEKLYQGKLEAEKNGQKYDIKIIEDKLANSKFVEKDGKIEVVFEDKSEEAKEKTEESDGPAVPPATAIAEATKAASAATSAPPTGSTVPPTGFTVPSTATTVPPTGATTPPTGATPKSEKPAHETDKHSETHTSDEDKTPVASQSDSAHLQGSAGKSE